MPIMLLQGVGTIACHRHTYGARVGVTSKTLSKCGLTSGCERMFFALGMA
jgi:hypothetical protein